MFDNYERATGFGVAIIFFGMIIALIFISSCSVKKDKEKFYNGHECGGHWEYQQAVGHQIGTSYIYKCNKCGDIIETDYYYNTEREEN